MFHLLSNLIYLIFNILKWLLFNIILNWLLNDIIILNWLLNDIIIIILLINIFIKNKKILLNLFLFFKILFGLSKSVNLA